MNYNNNNRNVKKLEHIIWTIIKKIVWTDIKED